MSEKINTDMVEIDIATDVLVIGGGITGLKTALEVSASGYKVVLTEKEDSLGGTLPLKSLMPALSQEQENQLNALADEVQKNDNINVLTNTVLSDVSGVPGDFNIKLSGTSKVTVRKVGAIVIASDFSLKSANDKYGLDLSDNVVTLSQMEKSLFDEKAQDLKNINNIAFLVGLEQETQPLIMERVVRCVNALEKSGECNAYVYVNNIKVASYGLSKLYKDGRDKGATYFKLDNLPEISNGSISCNDPVLRSDVTVTPDIIVVEETMIADSINEALSDMLRIDKGPLGFLQTDNVHRFPVQSNREGIFVAGSAKEAVNLSASMTDVANIVLKLKELLADGKKTVPAKTAVVDPAKCTICLTCYRCCPHGAMYWEGDKAVASPIACQSCGICASECPMDAIQIENFNDDAVKDEISKAIEDSSANNIVAFCCQNSAFEAGLMADALGMKVSETLNVIKVPCAGKVDLDYILTAFTKGADGVLVLACHDGNCKSEKGSLYAGWRVNDIHRMMEEIGLEKERLVFATLASNMGYNFSAIVNDMEATINEIGPSKVKN